MSSAAPQDAPVNHLRGVTAVLRGLERALGRLIFGTLGVIFTSFG